MCLSLRSDELFRDRPASRDVDDESRYERSQVESAVEPVGEGSQVMVCVLVVLQRMKSTGQRGLQVAEHCVDPLELRQIAGLESTDDKRHVATSSIGHRRETAQPIADHQGTRLKTGFGPITNGRRGETTDQVELDVHRMSCLVERDGRHERHLVLGAASWLAAGAFATQVGVVKLNRAVQAMSAVLLGDSAVDLSVQKPRRGLADTQVALERQRRKAGFGLADQVDGEEPCRQRQLGVLHQAARDQRGLVSASVALKQPACILAEDAVIGAVATRATESIRPSRLLDRLGAEGLKEFWNGHAVLELDLVEGHVVHSLVRELQLTGPLAHRLSLA